MMDEKSAQHFLNLGDKLAICTKDFKKRVLFQNENSIQICGPMLNQQCQRACAEIYPMTAECPTLTEGMRFYKGINIENRRVDALMFNDGQTITTLIHSPADEQDKQKQQIAFLKEKGLTESEIRIMKMVVQGFTNSNIAEELFISKATLKTHLNNIYKKLPASMHSSVIRG